MASGQPGSFSQPWLPICGGPGNRCRQHSAGRGSGSEWMSASSSPALSSREQLTGPYAGHRTRSDPLVWVVGSPQARWSPISALIPLDWMCLSVRLSPPRGGWLFDRRSMSSGPESRQPACRTLAAGHKGLLSSRLEGQRINHGSVPCLWAALRSDPHASSSGVTALPSAGSQAKPVAHLHASWRGAAGLGADFPSPLPGVLAPDGWGPRGRGHTRRRSLRGSRPLRLPTSASGRDLGPLAPLGARSCPARAGRAALTTNLGS